MSKQIRELNKRDYAGKKFQRHAFIDVRAAKVDKEERTVELAFSSDDPVSHGWYKVILDHSESSIRLDRIRQAGALLWNHDWSEQIGSVESVTVGDDNKCRAIVKFSQGEAGSENFQDVIDGIKRSVSFGFMMRDPQPEPGPDGEQLIVDDERVYRCFDWEPYEISLVSVPADINVGVGRSMKTRASADGTCDDCGDKTCPECNGCAECETCSCAPNENSSKSGDSRSNQNKEENMAKKDEETPATPAEQERTAAQNAEVTRLADFGAYGEQIAASESGTFGEFAREFAIENPAATFRELGAAILKAKRDAQVATPPADPTEVAKRNGQDVFEPAQIIHRGGPLKAFRGPDGKKEALRAGHYFRAAFYGDAASQEFCRRNGIPLERVHSGKKNSTGGVFVPVEIENKIIDLRIEYGVFRANADVVPMGSDTKAVRRRKSGLKAYPVGPGGAGTQSDTDWDWVDLVARKWMVLTKLEDELDEDSVINFADKLIDEIAYAFTVEEDAAGFIGDGTSTYHGIVGVTQKLLGVDSTIGNIKGLQVASGNAWSEIVEADLLGVVSRLPQFARKSGNVKWYCSHEFWAQVLERIILSKGGVTAMEIQGAITNVFLGRPVEIVETMPASEANSQIPLLYGNLSQAAVFGDRRGVTIKTSDSNDKDFESDLQTFKGTERFDINVHSVGNTTKAGPIVGLITAAS